jgi:aspartyl-tRNA synthetase
MSIGNAARESANAVSGDILRLIKETGDDPSKITVDPLKIAIVLKSVADGSVNRGNAKLVIEAIYKEDVDPVSYIKKHELETVRDDALLSEVVDSVIAANPQSVIDYKAGKDKAFGFLVGQSMKELKGKASPQDVNAKLKATLESAGVDVVLSAKATGTAAAEEAQIPDAGGQSDASSQAQIQGDREAYVPEVPAWKKKLSGETTDRESSDEAVPVQVSGRYRTFTCGDLTEAHIGSEALLAGWVHTIRDHGGIIFIDLRDQYGVTQVVVTEEMAAGLRKETSVSVRGKVLKRDEDTINPLIATGRIELKASEIEIVGECLNVLPFDIESSKDVKEELRLKYRYLDLRNPKVHDKIILRSEVIKYLRREMEDLGFTEIQTPILANSSPEGARDYLVPSRKHKGMFYALPQAPQQFKQLLLVSGFDRYFQIAPCFRDEDARLDRSPGEFYQLDFEMAYATQEDVFAVAERVLSETFKRFTDKPVSKPPYVRIPYAESMLKYGSDKPDLRNPLVIIDLSDFFAGVDFAPFRGKVVRAIRVPGAASQPKSFFKSMESYALSIGMKGLGYISVQDDRTYKGPIDKFFTDEQKKEVAALAGLEPKDVLYFISDERDVVAGYAGKIRTEVAARLDMIAKDRFDFCFITDYPMYEWNEDLGKIDFTHNPFSMPQGEMDALQNKDPEDILAWQYDIVCNGVELSSGAVRNHRPDVMVKAFEIAGYDEETVAGKFGALYSAFSFGAPPLRAWRPALTASSCCFRRMKTSGRSSRFRSIPMRRTRCSARPAASRSCSLGKCI